MKHVKCKNVKIQDYKNWKTYLWKNGKIKSVKHGIENIKTEINKKNYFLFKNILDIFMYPINFKVIILKMRIKLILHWCKCL